MGRCDDINLLAHHLLHQRHEAVGVKSKTVERSGTQWIEKQITSQTILTKKGQIMSINAGVWIDHHKAVVVRMTGNGEEVRQIKSNAERPFASAGGSGSKQPARPTGFESEDKQERKFMKQLDTFYDEVLTCLGDANSVLILGPGEAKCEFKKRLNTKKFPVLVADVETADKMTDRQIAANVRQHFELVPG